MNAVAQAGDLRPGHHSYLRPPSQLTEAEVEDVQALRHPHARQHAGCIALLGRHERVDLWVIGREVIEFDLPQTFASRRCSALRTPVQAHLGAMSADILLTPKARTGPVVNHEPGSDLGFTFVAGAVCGCTT